MPVWSVRIAFLCTLICSVQAAPGELDGTFGSPGRVLTSFPYPSWSFGGEGASAAAVLEQSDGKIITAGGGGAFYARHNPDGTPDTSFGMGGKFGNYNGGNSPLTAVAQQSDGRAVFGGYINSSGAALLMRAGLDGMPDPAFGDNGYIIIPGWSRVSGIAVQSDDKIILVGFHYQEGFLVGRVDADGQLDASFGNGGTVSVPFGPYGAQAWSVRIQSNGRIVVGGSTWEDDGEDFALACLLPSGVLDSTFGQGGKTVIELGGTDSRCLCLSLREGGKIVAGGYTGSEGQQHFALVACHENGALDAGFGVGGKIITPLSANRDKCTGLAVRADGKIIAVGQAYSSGGFNECIVARHNSDGVLDASFASGGRAFCRLAAEGGDANAVCLGAGGKIIVAGLGREGGRSDFALARFMENGTLDSGFRGGWMTSAFGGDNSVWDTVVQSDGKVLVCGVAFAGLPVVILARYDAAGVLDGSFGTEGRVSADFGMSAGNSIVLQPDGKSIVVGARGSEEDWVTARFLTDGSLDTSFGSGGYVTTSIGAGREAAYDVALQPDGKMVVVGTAQPGADYDFAVVRYQPDGILDASFGSGGKVITTLSAGEDVARAVAIQPDGKILVGGWATNNGNLDFAVVRYRADGALDTGFGTEGRTLTVIGQWADKAIEMNLQQDGKIILVGITAWRGDFGSPNDSVLVRYLPDGTLDTTFGSEGKVISRFNNESSGAYKVRLQADGRIVTAGTAADSNGVRGASLTRYNDDGSLDSTFGIGGLVHLGIGLGNLWGGAYGSSMAIQNDGALLLVGSTRTSSSSEWFVARYKAGPLLPMLDGGSALNISTSSTLVHGTVRPNGSTTTARVEYGPTAAYGSVASLALSPADGMATQDVSAGLSGLAPGTTYHYRLTASNAAGTRSTAGSSFTTLTLHQGWRQQHFGLATNTGGAADTFDFDGDGLPNLLEWACGLNPTTGSRLAQDTLLHADEMEFHYTRSVTAVNAGALFTVEWSDSLLSQSWSAVGVTQTVVFQDAVNQQVKTLLPRGTAGRRFVRLKVEAP